MKDLSRRLLHEYEFEKKTYNPKNNIPDCVISELDVLQAHYLLIDYFIIDEPNLTYGIKNFDLLSSAVCRQNTGYGDYVKWSDCYHKMASLFYGLTMDHAFHDANKRTALLTLLLYIEREGLVAADNADKLESLAVRIADNRLSEYPGYASFADKDDPEVNFIAQRIRKWTRPIASYNKVLTFAQFENCLKRFDITMDKPKGNFVNVYQTVATTKHLFLRWIPINSERKQFVCKIGYPGAKKQVPRDTIKQVLRKTGLTKENGFDDDVLYEGMEPLCSLILRYAKPLKRLLDK